MPWIYTGLGVAMVRPVEGRPLPLISRMAQLPAAFADLVVMIEDPIHRSNRAMVNTLVE